MNKKIFLIDNNNKKMKWLSTAWYRIVIFPIIDAVVLLLVVSTIIFSLNEFGGVKLYMGGPSYITYIWVVLTYIAINVIIAIFDFIKFNSLNNTMVVKENNNITIVKGLNKIRGASSTTMVPIFYNNSDSLLGSLASLGLYSSGAIEMQKSLTENDSKTIAEINKILDERNANYKYTDYKNCKLVNETKNYYEYIGEKDGVSSKFKIHKVYSNINLLNKEENQNEKNSN